MPGAGDGRAGPRSRPSERLSSALVGGLRRHLAAGGVVAYPTESCYGLGCDPRSRSGVARVLALKGRSRAKGLILIAADFRQLASFVRAPTPEQRRSLAAAWPGPVTFVMQASIAAPPWIMGPRGTVAVRVTAHPGAAALCRALRTALVSTSANRAGARPARSYADCLRRFWSGAWVLPGRAGRRRRPSTIIELETG
ncbi:MAG TPA: L-threonylcarbamoyladenylate synthase, partial [Burkholderiales bacterium]|nr:L-threonylcarbamoyladenylate synthase [Burkholderiales bacterium]